MLNGKARAALIGQISQVVSRSNKSRQGHVAIITSPYRGYRFEFDWLAVFRNDCPMMSKLIKCVLLSGLPWFIAANVYSEVATNSDARQLFKFKFALNKPLVYAVEYKSRTVSDISGGNRNSLTRNSSDVRYKIKLTAVSANQDGTTTVYYEPSDFEEDIEIVGPQGRVNTTTHGLDIVTKQNDIVMIDTSKGIGMSQAKNAKLPIYPALLSGYLYFEPSGNVKSLNGDLPFIDHWQDNLKYDTGFFHIIFPTNTISVRDSWTNNVAIKNVGGAFFTGDGIIQSNVFTRELDSSTDSNSIACFSLYESDINQNLAAYLEQGGQRTSMVVPECDDSINATFHFDQKQGRLIDVKETQKASNSMSIMVQGNSADSHNDLEMESSMTLVSP